MLTNVIKIWSSINFVNINSTYWRRRCCNRVRRDCCFVQQLESPKTKINSITLKYFWNEFGFAWPKWPLQRLTDIRIYCSWCSGAETLHRKYLDIYGNLFFDCEFYAIEYRSLTHELSQIYVAPGRSVPATVKSDFRSQRNYWIPVKFKVEVILYKHEEKSLHPAEKSLY